VGPAFADIFLSILSHRPANLAIWGEGLRGAHGAALFMASVAGRVSMS